MPSGRQKSKAKAKGRAQSGEAKAEPIAKPKPYKPLDYSKFNNIADSDEEEQGPSHHCEECERAHKTGMPKFHHSPSMPSGASHPGGNDADVSDEDDSPDDTSFSSEESRTWGPPEEAARSNQSYPEGAKRLAQAAAASAATAAKGSKTASAAAKPTPAKSAAPKPADSMLGFKAGFLTGKAEKIVDVSDDSCDDPEAPNGGPAMANGQEGPKRPSRQPYGSYKQAGAAGSDDSDSPPSLLSDEEDVPSMHYSAMNFNAQPGSWGTVSGEGKRTAKRAKASAGADSATKSAGSTKPKASPFIFSAGSNSSASSAHPAQAPASTAARSDASKAPAKYRPDQLRVAAAILAMLQDARARGPPAEDILRFNFAFNHPDTRPFLAIVPSSGELPKAISVLEMAGTDVLDGLARVARQCASSSMTARELFNRDCAYMRQPDDMPVAPDEAGKYLAEAAAKAARLAGRGTYPVHEDYGSSHREHMRYKIRDDLFRLASVLRVKVAAAKGSARKRLLKLYEAIVPALSPDLKGEPEAVEAAVIAAKVNEALRAYRELAANVCTTIQPILHKLIYDAGWSLEEPEARQLFDMLLEVVPHIDEPTWEQYEEQTGAQPASRPAATRAPPADKQATPKAKSKASSTAAPQNAAGSGRNGAVPQGAAAAPSYGYTPWIEAWLRGNGVSDEGGPEDMARVMRMAVLKMFDMRDLIAFKEDTPHYRSDRKHGGVSQEEASEFVETIIPGVQDLIEEQTLKEGEVDGTPGLDLIASHFAKVIESYKKQASSSKKTLSEIFDAKLASSRLGKLGPARRFVRSVEVPAVLSHTGFAKEKHVASCLKCMMPGPENVPELVALGGPAMEAALDRILSLLLESTDPTNTSKWLNKLVPEAAVLRTGMEDALARQFDKSVEPGFLCSPAEHLCKYLAKCVLQAEYAKMDLALYLDICKFGICGPPKDDRLAYGLMARLKTVANCLAKAHPEFSQQAVPPCLRALLSSGNLSRRQQTVLAMEGVAYDVRWVVGEPIIVQDPACKHLLSTEDEHFILQHARASRPDRPAASTQPSGSKKPFQQAMKGANSVNATANVSDDDASSCPSLETDDDLLEPHSGPAYSPPSPASSPSREPGSSRRSARLEDMDAAVVDNSDSDVDNGVQTSTARSASHPPQPPGAPQPDPRDQDEYMRDMVDGYPDDYPYPYPTGTSDYWPEQRGPKGVPEAEKARLREKMEKRRREQDAKALQEKLAASKRQEAERKAEEQRRKLADKLIEEEENAKKKAARQAEARAKKKAKKAKQRGAKAAPKAAKETSSDSEQEEEPQVSGSQGVQDSKGNEWQEHNLVALAGLKVSEASSPAMNKQEAGKAHAKSAQPAKARVVQPPAQPAKERLDANAVLRGADELAAAFGNVPRATAAVADAHAASSSAAAQKPEAPALAPAPEMLRELNAAIDSRDVDALEEAIKKSDIWVKRAPINHFMTQVRQKLKRARQVQKQLLPMGAASWQQVPKRDEQQQPQASAFPAAVQALFQRRNANAPPASSSAQQSSSRLLVRPAVPVQATPTRPAQPPMQWQAPGVRPCQPPARIPAIHAMQSPPPSTPAYSGVKGPPFPQSDSAKIAERPQQWQTALQASRQVADATVASAAHSSSADQDDNDDDLCVVCWDRAKEVLFLTCGHMCTCKGCAADIMDNRSKALCPMCRTKITSTMVAKF